VTKAVACNDTARKSHSHDCFHGRAAFAYFLLLRTQFERLAKKRRRLLSSGLDSLHARPQEELKGY